MTHQQITDKLAAKYLVQSMDEDLARLAFRAMCFHKDTHSQLAYLLPKIILRWNCVLNAGKEISDNYKQKTILSLAVLLHKYGFTDKTIIQKAIQAIDELNKSVALSDDFFRKSDEIKKVLNTAPVPLKRKPSSPESTTFYRARDVISIELNGKFHAAYIHQVTGINESPVIELYDAFFNRIPTVVELETIQAKGQIYNDGIERISLYAVYGMKYLPDLANQVKLIAASVDKKPTNTHLKESIGLYAVSDLFQFQEDIIKLFHKN